MHDGWLLAGRIGGLVTTNYDVFHLTILGLKNLKLEKNDDFKTEVRGADGIVLKL